MPPRVGGKRIPRFPRFPPLRLPKPQTMRRLGSAPAQDFQFAINAIWNPIGESHADVEIFCSRVIGSGVTGNEHSIYWPDGRHSPDHHNSHPVEGDGGQEGEGRMQKLAERVH
jgi:hypothetical protein